MIIDEVISITTKSIIVNEEQVYVIESNMSDELDALNKYIEVHKDETVVMYLKNLVDFILKHNGFAIVFRPLKRKSNTTWLLCCVYSYGNEWLRVTIENASCSFCEWKGIVANPTIPDLYFGMNNEVDILKRMNSMEFLRCPECGSAISRKAIWIEKKN